MARPNTLRYVPVEQVLETLNSTKTLKQAVRRLTTTRQTLNNYMRSNGIERNCIYVQATTTITTHATHEQEAAE